MSVLKWSQSDLTWAYLASNPLSLRPDTGKIALSPNSQDCMVTAKPYLCFSNWGRTLLMLSTLPTMCYSLFSLPGSQIILYSFSGKAHSYPLNYHLYMDALQIYNSGWNLTLPKTIYNFLWEKNNNKTSNKAKPPTSLSFRHSKLKAKFNIEHSLPNVSLLIIQQANLNLCFLYSAGCYLSEC